MIEVLKQALDAFHQIFESTVPYREDGTCTINDKSIELSNKAITSLRQAIAELENQGKTMKVEGPLHVVCQCDKCKQLEEQAYDLLGQLKVANLKLSVRSRREWVGLTDEDIGDEYVRFEIQGGFNKFEYAVKAIEAKLKEKNNA